MEYKNGHSGIFLSFFGEDCSNKEPGSEDDKVHYYKHARKLKG